MSFQTFVTERLAAITALLNAINTNAKKIDELPEQTTLDPNSRLHVSRNGTSERIEVQTIISAITDNNFNQIISIDEITTNGNVVTIPAGAQWKINNVIYSTIADTVITIPYCATGKNRIDILAANTSSAIVLIQGTETSGIAVRPNIPLNTVLVTQINVTDEDISPPSDPELSPYPIIGQVAITKKSKQSIYIYNIPVNGNLPRSNKTHYVFTGDASVGDSVKGLTNSSSAQSDDLNYQNQKYSFTNYTDFPITFKYIDSLGEIKFHFPNETDFILTPRTNIEFFHDYVNNWLCYVGVVAEPAPDATTLIKGKVKLAGDLGGTADLPTVPGLATKQALFSGVTNKLPKSLNATTLVPSRIVDTGTYIGIDTVNTPTKDITLGNQANREIGVEQSENTVIGRDLIVGAGRTINFVPNLNFNPTGQTPRDWKNIDRDPNGDVFLVVNGYQLYRKLALGNDFLDIGVSFPSEIVRTSGFSIAYNGDQFGLVNVGTTTTLVQLYKRTGRTGSFLSLGQTTRDYTAIEVALNGDIYVAERNGDIYIMTGGTGNLVALGQVFRDYSCIASASNGNIYAKAGGNIYVRINGAGDFVFHSIAPSYYDEAIAVASNNDMYAIGSNSSDIFKQTNSTGSFISLNQVGLLGAYNGNVGVITITPNGNVYYAYSSVDVFLQNNDVTGTPNLNGGILKLKAGTGKGTGTSKLQFITGAKTVSGTDMQIETVRGEIDENGTLNHFGNITSSALVKSGQYTTATRPAYVKGAFIFDTTLNKSLIGGASNWEVISSS